MDILDTPLTRMIRRLEAATSRLEDIASSAHKIETAQPGHSVAESQAASKTPSINGDHGQLARSGPLGVAQSREPPREQLPPSIEAFDQLVEEELKTFLVVAEKLGDPIDNQSTVFGDAFRAQRDVLLIATKAKAPSETAPIYQEILADLIKGIQSVHNIREEQRKTPAENHLSMIADGSGILSWVTIKPGPDKYVAEVLGGAQFYGNKILSEFKGKDTSDIEWVKSFVKLCGALITYIKEYHARGLEWNSLGSSPEDAVKEVNSAHTNSNGLHRAPSDGLVPPPPPPPPGSAGMPPPPPPPLPTVRSPPAGGDMSNVFADLNRGEGVTAGLRRVDKSEMTHKNPVLRAQGATPILERNDSSSSAGRGKSPQPPIKRKPDSMRTKKPPRKELDGQKWIVENFENEQNPIEISVERQQSILISKCKSVVIKVNGKANAISLDNCSKTDMLVESLVSSVDVINTASFRLQVDGNLPSIQLDKVDGAVIFLSKQSLDTEVYTSKCSSINITLPPANDEDDSVECPVPEQLRTVVVDGKLVNEIVKQEG